MEKTNLPMSLKDTKELRQMILNNPDLPILIFCGEDVNNGDYSYMSSEDVRVEIKELTLYADKWIDENDFEDEIRNDCEDWEECIKMNDKEFDEFIQEKINKTEFVKVIVVYVG